MRIFVLKLANEAECSNAVSNCCREAFIKINFSLLWIHVQSCCLISPTNYRYSTYMPCLIYTFGNILPSTYTRPYDVFVIDGFFSALCMSLSPSLMSTVLPKTILFSFFLISNNMNICTRYNLSFDVDDTFIEYITTNDEHCFSNHA